MRQTVSLSFYRFPTLSGRLWAFGQMGFARIGLRQNRDIGFWKLCGSGTGEGFTPVLLPRVFAILATWPDEIVARTGIETDPAFLRFRRRSAEHWTVLLAPSSVRGHWSGATPFEAGPPLPDGPVAALTRATVRLRTATRFWRRVPEISDRIGRDTNVAFKIGIGEVPLLHQVTFSIWPDARSMADFARTGAHAEAIRAVRENGWFREELYARFSVVSDIGTWNGTSPLSNLPEAA